MQQQDELRKMFAEIDDEGRRYVMAVARAEFNRVLRLSPPRLRLVSGTDVVASPLNGQVNPLPVSGPG